VYSQLELPESLKNCLENLEQELEVPIRCLNGDWETRYSPPDWDNIQAGNFGVNSIEFAEKNGITIISWSSTTGGSHTGLTKVPGVFFKDEEERNSLLRDYFTPGNLPLAEHVREVNSGLIYAEVAERTVWHYFWFELLPDPENIDYDLFIGVPVRRSLEPDLVEKIKEQGINRSKQEFLQICNTRLNRQIEDARDNIGVNERQLIDYERAVTTQIQNLRDRRDILNRIETRIGQEDSHWSSEWEKLNRHPRIKNINLNNERVEIETDTVIMTHPDNGKAVKLGRFRVSIDNNNGIIDLENLDNPRRGRAHPHVPGINPCWGSLSSTVSQLQAEGEYIALMETVFQYLESYNPEDDYGTYSFYWFDEELPENREILVTTE